MITINGKSYEGNDVSVINGQITVDGKPIEDLKEASDSTVRIEVTGDLTNLKCDGVVTVNGNVHGNVKGDVVTVHGDIKGNVSADVVSGTNVGGNMAGRKNNSGQTVIIPGLTINA